MSENTFILPSFAKINWDLRVLGKRDDGFHELFTIFQTISLYDEISFAESDELILTCDNLKIPVDENNLIIKTAKSLQNKFDVNKGAKIHLEKKIPAPGGLGGGSSNAAVAMLGLMKLWNLKISFEKLVEIAAEIGSDVPFFLYGGTSIGIGRGTEIEPIEDVTEKYVLLITPEIDVPTKDAFKLLNAPYLTKENSKRILKLCRNEAEKLDLRQKTLKNDFESAVFKLEPEIELIKNKLIELGAVQAILSGSGASVFAIFDTQETRQATQKALVENTNWRMFAVATISRNDYREALNRCFSLLPISF